MELLTPNGQADHGPPDPLLVTAAGRLHMDEQLEHDMALLQLMHLRCCECRRHGSAAIGNWELVSGQVYCRACATAEAHQ